MNRNVHYKSVSPFFNPHSWEAVDVVSSALKKDDEDVVGWNNAADCWNNAADCSGGDGASKNDAKGLA